MADAVTGMLRVARVLVETRRQVDLTGLADAVGRLCAGTLDLPDTEGRALRPRLVEVLAELNALDAAIRANPPGSVRDTEQ
jgi:hypothetical protein